MESVAVAAPGRTEAAPHVSIVLAVLNEKANLSELADRLRALPLPPFEVIVVDDGSVDGTREFALTLSASDPRFRTILHDGKQTTLRAQCLAIEGAQGRLVVVMDSDLQHPPELLPEMIGRLEAGASVVVASRYTAGGSPGRRSPMRAFLSRGAEWVAKLLLPEARAVSDPVSGFFGFRAEIFRSIDPRHRGYKLLLFVLVMSRGQGVEEVGYRFEPRTEGASKVTQGLGFVRVFLTEVILAQRLRRELSRRPSHGPAPLGTPR